MNRFLLIILFFPFLLSAQDRTIDSLKIALKNAKHDTTRCNILNMMVEIENDDNVWPIYNEQLLELCEKNLVTTTPTKVFYLRHLAAALNNIGFLAKQQGKITKAIEYYHRSLKIHEEIKDDNGIATSLNNIGFIFDNQGDIPKALDYYHRSLKIRENIKDNNGIALSLNNIGEIYKNQGDISKALDYHRRSLKIREFINDKKGIAVSLNNVGVIYYNQGSIKAVSTFERDSLLSNALAYYQRSLKIRKEINDKPGIATSLNNIGLIYDNQSDIPEALDYYQKSLKIRGEINDKKGITISLNNIARAMLKRGLLGEALKYGTQSLQTAQGLGFPANIKNTANTLKKIYQKQNNFKTALEMYELEIQMQDSINNTETKKASIKKQFQYEYEKKAAADSVKHTEEQKVKNALLTAQQAQLKQEKTQRLALYAGLVLVIAFLAFVVNRFRVIKKQKVIIEQQKVMVDNAFAHLEEKNREVMDSIHYAKRIQTALLTSEKYIERKLNQLNS